MDEIIRKYTIKIVKEFEGNLEALILVGSFSRGEGKFYQNNGKLELISDIEFWAVVKNLSAAKHIEQEKLTIGFTTKRHLPKLKPYIFTVETKKFGQVVWGERNILDYIPDYSERDIALLDGFILLNNRIVEQLELLDKIEQGKAIYQYELNKGYIQIVNSLLAFNKRYKSLYPEKIREFRNVYKKGNANLIQKVEEAFDSLEQPQAKILSKEEALAKWQELRGYFKEVWVYEVENLLRVLGTTDKKYEMLIEKFVRIPNLGSRIKGWGKVFLAHNKKLFKSLRKIPFWLFRSSPQFLIYQKAIKEYFGNKQDMDRVRTVVETWKNYVK